MLFLGISPLDLAIVTFDAVEDNYYSFVENSKLLSVEENLNGATKELRRVLSKDDLKSFRIVTKNELIVRDGKKLNTKINGKLNKSDVIQIVEKERNRTYIIFYNKENDEVIKGWVSTRYLKKIK